MKYLIKLIKSLKEVIITYILQYLIIIISCYIYYKLFNKNINYFINKYCLYILIITNILLIIYLFKKNKITEKKFKKKECILYISLGVSISCIINMLIFIFYKPTISNNLSLILLLISSGIIGPIYEEILFRYVFYNKIKKFNSTQKTIIINSIIFAIIHINIIKVLFAFILGLIINITYEKKKNIIYPIIIHMSANSVALLLNEFSSIILFLSTLLFIITIKNIKLT